MRKQNQQQSPYFLRQNKLHRFFIKLIGFAKKCLNDERTLFDLFMVRKQGIIQEYIGMIILKSFFSYFKGLYILHTSCIQKQRLRKRCSSNYNIFFIRKSILKYFYLKYTPQLQKIKKAVRIIFQHSYTDKSSKQSSRGALQKNQTSSHSVNLKESKPPHKKLNPEELSRICFAQKAFLKVLKNPQKNTCAGFPSQ